MSNENGLDLIIVFFFDYEIQQTSTASLLAQRENLLYKSEYLV